MMYPKPKSAPGRFVQSKFVKNRTNAMKEIEAWVKKDDDRGGSAHEASRMSGQLTDNVTEERMLRAKLWELSKERYKFLTQNAYEKKMFADRMQRKSSALLRRANSAAASSSRDGDTEPLSPAKQRWRMARMALFEGRNSAKRKGQAKAGEDDKAKGDEKRTRPEGGSAGRGGGGGGGGQRRVVMPAAAPVTPATAGGTDVAGGGGGGGGGCGGGGGRVALSGASPAAFHQASREDGPATERHPTCPKSASGNPRNVKFNRVPSTDTGRQPGGSTGSRGNRGSPHTTPGGTASSGPGPFTTRPPSGSAASSKPNSATSSRSKPWPSTTTTPIVVGVASALVSKRGIIANRFGMRLESKTTDPRYAQLEHSLSPIQKQRGQADVRSIVQNFDALHVPPRRRKEAKPKTELKALEYIEEQGFAF